MTDDDLLDVLQLVARRLDGGLELVLGLVVDAAEDVGDDGAPDGGVVDAAAGLPQDDAVVRVVDEDAVHGQAAALVDEGLVLGAHERRVAAADDETLVGLEPADLEQVRLGARRAHVGDVVGHGARVERFLDPGHCFFSFFLFPCPVGIEER